MNAADANLLPLFGAGILLMLLNGVLVAAELALLRVCLSHFEPELAERLREREALRSMIDHAESTVRLARSSSLLCVILYAFTLLRAAQVVYVRSEAAWGTYGALAAALCLFAFGYGLYAMCGIILPRALGLKHPAPALGAGRVALFFFAPLRLLVLKPIRALTTALLRMAGVKDLPGLESLGFEEQIEHSNEGSQPMPVMARKIFRNALDMRGLVVSDVLLPRHQVQWMDLNDSPEENMKLARQTGHTRFPLCDGDLDRCVGMVHIKDVFRKVKNQRRVDLPRIKREMLRISPDMSVEEALQLLLGKRQHMALVVDEFRGAEGIITLERLLELLVGDIRDEFDIEEDNIRKTPNGEYNVSGLTPVYELERELDVEFENQDVSSFGGLITAELGRIPEQGEHLVLDGLDVIVTEVDERRVIWARVRKTEEAPEEE
ncbi:MAG: HlyC/CorC family transporter [Opitutales bacterium]|nr:HlyC/CorC family transporter [Opitutales bacterium]